MRKRLLFLLLSYALFAEAQLPTDNGIRYADVEYISRDYLSRNKLGLS